MQGADLVTVAVFTDPIEARLAKGRLEEAGISAVLTGEEIALTQWNLKNANGAIRLDVWSHEVARAEAVLSDPDYDVSDEELTEAAVGLQAEAEEQDDYGAPNDREAMASRAYRAALLGVPFVVLQPYATWLILQAAFNSKQPLRCEFARRLRVAGAVNAVMLGLIVLWIVMEYQMFHNGVPHGEPDLFRDAQ